MFCQNKVMWWTVKQPCIHHRSVSFMLVSQPRNRHAAPSSSWIMVSQRKEVKRYLPRWLPSTLVIRDLVCVCDMVLQGATGLYNMSWCRSPANRGAKQPEQQLFKHVHYVTARLRGVFNLLLKETIDKTWFSLSCQCRTGLTQSLFFWLKSAKNVTTLHNIIF